MIKIGRPRKQEEINKVRDWRAKEMSYSQIASIMGIHKSRVQYIVHSYSHEW